MREEWEYALTYTTAYFKGLFFAKPLVTRPQSQNFPPGTKLSPLWTLELNIRSTLERFHFFREMVAKCADVEDILLMSRTIGRREKGILVKSSSLLPSFSKEPANWSAKSISQKLKTSHITSKIRRAAPNPNIFYLPIWILASWL